MRSDWIAAAIGILAILSVGKSSAQTQYLDITPTNALKPLGLLWRDSEEFNPSVGNDHEFAFATQDDTQVTLDVMSPDADVVKRLLDSKTYQKGRYTITWDGKDDNGVVVPDEAWTPLLKIQLRDGSVKIDDPSRYSGGEIIPDIDWNIRGDTELSFDIPYAARVLIRSGIDEGPMMRVIRRWEPVAGGKVVVRWDGFDANQLEYFAGHDDRWFVVMAYQLPEFAVISTGNADLNYREYRQLRQWPEPAVDLTTIELQRNGQRLSKDYFLPRSFQPRVSIEFAEPVEVSNSGLPVVLDKAVFRINVPEEDRWVLASSFYETGFYVDYKFQSEEEQGFVPMIWQYDTSELPVGRHIATVQLFGFGGFISSSTIAFEVLQSDK